MPRPLKVGVQLPEAERDIRWAEIRAMARLAEDVGFDSLWVGDHLLYRTPAGTPRGPWEAWSTLAALAATTNRVELGPLVAAAGFHGPAMIAKKAATIEEISGGRLILGLGAGWNETEYRGYGFPFDHRVSRFEEAFTIIRTLLRDGAIDFDGRFHQARDCVLVPRGPRPAGPPLMVGSMGARMLAITAPHVDLWNGWYDWFENRPAGLAALATQVDDACRRAGRLPSEVGRTAAVLVQLDDGRGRVRMDPDAPQVIPVAGHPEEIAEVLAMFATVGISHLQLVLDPITERSIAALAPVLDLLDARS
jgi:alkanesulfonate monooxygenase SsuD/methylene tetrahydromethanopterin reductase-like flavin-dependent oxidoreductase (luciferase family)